MSALGFFRQRQKMVFWIMVFLMIVFLITIGGIEPFMQLVTPSSKRVVYGEAGATSRYKIKMADVHNAAMHLELLNRIGLGEPRRILLSTFVPQGPQTELPGE